MKKLDLTILLGEAESIRRVLGAWGRLDREIGRFGMGGCADLGEGRGFGDVPKR